MLKIEDTEIKTWDKHESQILECGIKNGVFSSVRNETTVFNSELFKYDDLSVVVNRESRYSEYYYNIAVVNTAHDKAWPLITVPTKLENYVKRLSENNFIIWNDKPGSVSDIKQCTFCTIHENEKQDHITVDFHILHSIEFLPQNKILISFSQILGGVHVEQSVITTLAMYEPSGKLVKTIYEFNVDDKVTYDYKHDVANEKIIVRELVGGKAKNERIYDSDTLTESVSETIKPPKEEKSPVKEEPKVADEGKSAKEYLEKILSTPKASDTPEE